MVLFLGAATLLFAIEAKPPKKEIIFLRGREHLRDAEEKAEQAQYLKEWGAEDFKRLGLKALHLVEKGSGQDESHETEQQGMTSAQDQIPSTAGVDFPIPLRGDRLY